ncbi:MAG: CzcE family metal-binding protein [Gammaproteobacteria bacterium]
MKKFLIVAAAVLSIPLAAMAASPEKGRQHANGQAASASAATHTKKIGPKTKYVHVNHGDTVTFVVGHKTFTWHFDTNMSGANFPLAAIAPADVPTQGVRVYVAPNPLYLN